MHILVLLDQVSKSILYCFDIWTEHKEHITFIIKLIKGMKQIYKCFVNNVNDVRRKTASNFYLFGRACSFDYTIDK